MSFQLSCHDPNIVPPDCDRNRQHLDPKPSERDPGAAMIIAELCAKAGLPEGVVNIVHGGHKAVNFIIDEPSRH